MSKANVLVVIMAVLGGLAAIGIFWAGGVLEKYAAIREDSYEARLSEATRAATEAGNTASRTSLATENLRERQRPRLVTEEQKAALVAALGEAEIEWVGLSFRPEWEPSHYAFSLKAALEAAGIKSNSSGSIAIHELHDEVLIARTTDEPVSNKEQKLLVDALNGAGIPAKAVAEVYPRELFAGPKEKINTVISVALKPPL